MFSDYEDDMTTQEAVPLIYTDNEEWETIPNSKMNINLKKNRL